MISVAAPSSRSVTDKEIRCGRCRKLLAEVASRPWRIRCVRCGHTNAEAGRDAPEDEPKTTTETKREPKHRPTTKTPQSKPRRGKRKAAGLTAAVN